jgi:NhaP-type Na+/H+ or K+/H+ antiporter
MTATIQTLLLLLVVLVVVAILARRLNTAPSILLVIAGIGLALVPGLPPIELAPELVLLGILPPLIYSAGVAMSWREFRFNLRPITLLAFGCVIFTTCAVAITVHWLLGVPLAVAFVLGAIVAPPMWSHLLPSPGAWACRAGSWSCSKVRASPMMPRL